MDKAYDYITNASYPIEMNVIMSKIFEFCQDEDSSSLFQEAIINNSEKIISDFIPRIKKQGENLADSKKEDYLAENGIPDFDASLEKEISKICQRIFKGYYFDMVSFQNQLKEYFYSSYTKRLLQKSHFFSQHINKILNHLSLENSINFKQSLDNYNNFVIGTPKLNDYIGIEIPGIERIYPKLQKVLNKKCYENFINVFKGYINKKWLELISIDIPCEEIDLIQFSCLVLSGYECKPQDYIHFLHNLIEICFEMRSFDEHTKYFWGSISIKERIDIYIYIYLIASKSLPKFLKPPPEEFYSRFLILESKKMPEIREMLRKFSKNFFIFIPSVDNFDFSYIKNPFECFKIIEMSLNNFLDDQSISRNPDIPLNPKKFKQLTNNNSSHIIIVVSGYLSQEDDHKNEWRHLISLYPNNTFYSYTWKSSTTKEMIFSILKLSFVKRHFNEFYSKAEKAGIELARKLINSPFFREKSISLVGFSLGTVVINNCLQRLSTERTKIIHDCILLGSALDIKAAQYNKDLKNHVVAGKFYNVFSTRDFILNELFCLTAISSAYGTQRVPGMKNKDVSDIISAHKQYRENLGKIFKRIKNF